MCVVGLKDGLATQTIIELSLLWML